MGDLGYIASIPIYCLCVWLTCRLARLGPHQILAGCLVVCADAMLIDGIALRWFPAVYGVDDHLARTGAAWLLWSYGLTSWIALGLAERRLRSGRAGASAGFAVS